ncbi:MAG: metal-dependent hydrolase [Deltaproteobacteria bacterium]|nr:metal-dependent hydrolase [Deltaproteobacteria bacterium]
MGLQAWHRAITSEIGEGTVYTGNMHPFTHAAAGWLIAQPGGSLRDRKLITAAAVIPDVDGLAILGGGDAYSRLHHTFGHNLWAGAAFAVFTFVVARRRFNTAVLSFVAFNSHIVGDLLGSGEDWPIPYFWPVSSRPYSFVPPFQWELVSWQNILITVILIGAIVRIGYKRGRTIVECVSPSADRSICAAIQSRLA